MAGLDFDKMDDLELFVRHFRHKVAGLHGPIVSDMLCDAIDFAWAEVSVRREREHTAWVNGRGLDFLTREPTRQRKGGGK